MKIINLLEGSEVLFHLTSGIKNILTHGMLSLSPLVSNEAETQSMQDKLKVAPKKMFYLSFARSLHSDFIRTTIPRIYRGGREPLTVFEFNGSRISRYGKVAPFNFMQNVMVDPGEHVDDEMEDRLVSDHSAIPITAATRLHVVCSDADVHIFEVLSGKYDIPMTFYTDPKQLQLRRGGMTLVERKSKMGEASNSVIKQRPSYIETYKEFASLIIQFANTKKFDVEQFKKLFSSVGGAEFNSYITQLNRFEPSVANSVMHALRKAGFNSPDKLNQVFGLMNKYSKSGG